MLRERPPADWLDDRVLADVCRDGFAHVPGALRDQECAELLREADANGGRFLALPDRVNGVEQRADQLSVRVGDRRHPAVNRLVSRVCRGLARWPAASLAPHFVPTEARYMRYTGGSAGLGAHRDGKCYRLIVCVFSLTGSASFLVSEDDPWPGAELMVEQGDLVVLRAPGFWGGADGRRRHAVGPPLEGERVSLTLRMVGATAPPAGRTASVT